jgi:hypothetical protein
LFSSLLAGLVGSILRRSLTSARFDQQLERWGFTGIADWSPGQSPTRLVTRLVSWSIVLLGFVAGLEAFDASLTSRLAFNLFSYVPNILAAVLLIVVGIMLSKYLARNILIEGVNMNMQYARLISVGVKWMVMVLAVAMALDHLQIATSIVHLAFGILFGGIVLALALAIGLGSKELVSRSLERESAKETRERKEPFRHL